MDRPKPSSSVFRVNQVGFAAGMPVCAAVLAESPVRLTDGNGKLHLTVAGVNKKRALPYLIDKYGKEGIYDHFNKDLKIPGEHSGKLTHYYIDDHCTGYVTDYLGKTIKYDCRSAVYMEKASYNFSIPAQYLEYINKFNEEDIIEC